MIKKIASLPSVDIKDANQLPKLSGIYFIISGEDVLYIGKTNNLFNRLSGNHAYKDKINSNCCRIFYLEMPKEKLLDAEKQFISLLNPRLNIVRPSTKNNNEDLFNNAAGDVFQPTIHEKNKSICNLLSIAGLTLAQAGELCGVTPRTIANWRDGKTDIPARALALLQAAAAPAEAEPTLEERISATRAMQLAQHDLCCRLDDDLTAAQLKLKEITRALNALYAERGRVEKER